MNVFAPARMIHATGYITGFGEVRPAQRALLGSATIQLGEMYQELTAKGIRVPNGFAISAQAYRDFLIEAGLQRQIREALWDLDSPTHPELPRRAAQIRQIILAADLPSV